MSRTYLTAAPGGWTLYWELRDPGIGWGMGPEQEGG